MSIRKQQEVDNESEKKWNQTENVGKSGIGETLDKAGLDGEYWTKILKKRLGITRTEQIKHLRVDDLQKLHGDIRNGWELNALKECFGISEETSKNANRNQTKEQARRILDDVRSLRDQGVSHTNDLMKSKLDELRSILDVTDEQWIKPSDGKSLDIMITQLTSEVEQMDTLSEGKHTYSPSELLENASGGLALRGVLLGTSEDCDNFKRTVLRTPQDVRMMKPIMEHIEEEEYFSSKEKFDQFKRSLNTMGYNFNAAAKGGGFAAYGYVEAEATVSKNIETEDENTSKSHNQSTSEYRMKYAFIPIASCELKKSSLELSQEALEDLQEIDQILALSKDREHEEIVNKKCVKFLNSYGSHINVGLVHFGGVNQFIATYTSDTASNSDTTRSMMRDALNVYVSVSYSSFAFSVGGSIGYDQLKTHGDFTGKYSESELAKTTFKTIRNGGPQEQCSFPLWKRGLVQHNSTWRVIDRGNEMTEDFVGIWTIISKHHRDDFEKPDKLAFFLKAAWEKMTSAQKSRDKERPLINAKDTMDLITKKITELDSRPIEPKMCIENLNWILENVAQVAKLTDTNSSWEHNLCTNKHISSFLRKIVELDSQFDSGTASEIRLVIRKLIEPVKDTTFPEKQLIVSWAEGTRVSEKENAQYTLSTAVVQTIPGLIENMKTFLIEIEEDNFANTEQDMQIRDSINRKATNSLTLCVSKLLVHLQESTEVKQIFFLNVTLLSLDYHWSQRQFKKVLQWYAISNFVKKLDDLWTELLKHEGLGRIQHESFLLHNLLTSDHFVRKKSTENEFSEITKGIRQILSPELTKVLDRYASDSPYDWDEMIRVIAELKNGNMTVIEEFELDIDDLEEVFAKNDGIVQHRDQSKPNKHQGTVEDAFSDMLKTLGIDSCYPSKISLQDALVIREFTDHPMLVDLPWMIIHRLIMIDYQARDQLFALLDGLNGGDEYDAFNEIFGTKSTSTSDGKDNTTQLYPLDVMVAIFTCCDNILKQTLAQKMFVCKLAIPFLYPMGSEGKLMMSLWALRTINVQCHEKKGSEYSVTTKPLPMVTFVRLGRPPISKSKLMNDILTDNSHDTFFNYDCTNGTVTRSLTDGLVECSWFITEGKETDHLPRTTMFLNLRGDASVLEKQMKVLHEISSVIFVIVTANDLKKEPHTSTCRRILQSTAKIIFLISASNLKERDAGITAVGMDHFLKKKPSIMKYTNNQGKFLNASERKTSARNLLSKIIDGSNSKQIEDCARLAEKSGVITDEQAVESCVDGKTLANNVLCHMKSIPLVEYKDRVLLLQGTEWNEYCNLKKKRHRESKNSYEAEQISQQMNRHRKKQVKLCQNGLAPLIKDFMTILQMQSNAVVYFLKWMSIYLNDKSRETLPGLRMKYHDQWIKFQESKKVQQKTSSAVKKKELEILKSEMDRAERDISSASLGLEHLFRELGQIYEAVKGTKLVSKNTKKLVDRLPEIAAELLTKGYPMEIIDGDTSSVPITWVSAVLNKLGNIIGEKRLFVISVLGIQSSGKSTLLNTMFGLQFSVSAGRCTRGAYMQLIRVADGQLPFDFVVVIDTEGLRAAELSHLHHNHDNELATLVIGLGDLTMINIKGENVTEMTDILQIAVHAFLRMNRVSKNIRYKKSCIFTHQNVPATNAGDMLKQASHKLLETLDKMTEEAANSENIADIYSFSQIIDFDFQKNVWYFSDLWHGNPPMAPANSGYSEKVGIVRRNILYEIANEQTTSMTASNLSRRITDLWEGVLADDFVFSFRNSLEVTAHNALQFEYYNLEWTLQMHLQTWRNQAERNLRVKETTKELERQYNTLINDLPDVLNAKVVEIRSTLEDYFKNNNLRDIIIPWKSATMRRLEYAEEKERQDSKKNLLRAKESRRLAIMDKGKWISIQKSIIDKANKLAEELRGKEMTDDEMKRVFNDLWEKSKNELTTTIDEKEEDMHLLIEEVLRENFTPQGNILYLLPELGKHSLNTPLKHASLDGTITVNDVSDGDISIKRELRNIKAVYSDERNVQAKKFTVVLTADIFQEISTYLTLLKKNRDIEFKTSYVTNVLKEIIQRIKTFNEDNNNFFKITHKYTAKIAVLVSRHCVKVFSRMRSDYNKEHSISAKLDQKRESIWSQFKNTVNNSTQEVIAGDALCRELKGIIVEQVRKEIPTEVVKDLLADLGSTKFGLMTKILEDLAIKGNFHNYQSYIFHAKGFSCTWLTKYTNEYMFEDEENGKDTSYYANKCKLHIERIMKCFRESVNHATERAVEAKVEETMKLWIEQFCKKVVDVIPVPVSELGQVQERKVVDFNHLKAIIFDQLDVFEKDLVKVFADETEDTVKWNGEPPAKRFLDKVWGCDAQCPLCREPCSNTTPGHYDQDPKQCHQCVKHKPKGITGITFVNDKVVDGVKVHSADELIHDTCNYSIQREYATFRCSACSYECRKYNKCTSTEAEGVSHKYREYKTYLEEWDITPDSTNSVSKYWMWFMNKYQHQLTDYYQSKLPQIPESWKSITMEEALDDLRYFDF